MTSLVATASFPELLRHHRIRAGLTQRALADLSTVSPRAIRDLEAGRANARTQTIHLLADGLRLQGVTRDVFVSASLSRRPTGPGDDRDAAPAGTGGALLGRDAEVRTIMAVLESGHRRMISISGLPGVGKTRVAAEIAAGLNSRRRWPVLWIGQRGPEATGALVRSWRSAVAPTLDDVSRIRRLVGRRHALLVLDGIAAAGPAREVEDLLAACPGLRAISTSRTPWHVAGVQAAVISPLDTPEPGCLPADVVRLPSVRLLVERLAEIRPGFTLSASEVGAAAEMCRRLDGLPLALEAVAGRGRVLSLHQLVEMPVTDLLDLDVPARPGEPATTIGGLIGASLTGLHADHRAVLAELARSDRAWTVAAAAAALHRPLGQVMRGLDVLIGHGLVQASHREPAIDLRVPHLLRAYLRRGNGSGRS